MNETNFVKPYLCKIHNMPAYEICLHGSPMKNRLLCKICKQRLNKEQLLEVISLNDFLSTNFLKVVDSLIKQTKHNRIAKDRDKRETTINDFFEKLELCFSEFLKECKSHILNKINGDINPSNEPITDLEIQKNIVESRLIDILKNNKHDDDVIMDSFAKDYMEMNESLTKHLSTFSSQEKRKKMMLKEFEDDSRFEKAKNHMKLMFETLENLQCKQYNEDPVQLIEQENISKNTSQIKKTKRQKKEVNINSEYISPLLENQIKRTLSQRQIKEGNQQLDLPTKASKKSTNRNTMIIEDSDNELVKQKEEYPEYQAPSEIRISKSTPMRMMARKQATLPFNNDPEESSMTDESTSMNNKIPNFQYKFRLQTKHDYIYWGGLCYIQDKGHLITGGKEGVFKVWDIESTTLIASRKIGSKIYKIIYIQSKGSIFIGTDTGQIAIFDINKNYDLTCSYLGHSQQVYGLVYLPRHDMIASSGTDGNIRLWCYDSNEMKSSSRRILDTGKRNISNLCYIEEQDLLVAGALKGGYLMFFNPDKSQCVKIVKAHSKDRSVDSLVYVKEWNQLISGSEDSYIKFWDLDPKNIDWQSSDPPRCLKSLRRDESFIESLVVFPKAGFLCHMNLDEYFTVWSLKLDEQVQNIVGHSKGLAGEAMIYLEDRNQLLTGFTDEVVFWDIHFDNA